MHTVLEPTSYQEEQDEPNNTVADLFSVDYEAQLFSPMEATQSYSSSDSDPLPVERVVAVGPEESPMMARGNERLRKLLRAIESYDRYIHSQ